MLEMFVSGTMPGVDRLFLSMASAFLIVQLLRVAGFFVDDSSNNYIELYNPQIY